VTHFQGDRTDMKSLTALGKNHWDYIFDQICYCSKDAEITSKIFEGKVGKYIFTSTGSVYSMDVPESGATEDMFDPLKHELKMGNAEDFDYGEGKRQAESYLFQKSNFSVSSLRFPIVLGHEDTSGRLNWHIQRIKQEQNIYFPNIEGKLSFITDKDAARALIYYAEYDQSICVNVHSQQVRLKNLVKVIEKTLKKEALYSEREIDDNHSPYGIKSSWGLDISKTIETGFTPQGNILELVEEITNNKK